jgi:glycosyltransferase involved in cell wall biosynthesis
MDRRIAVVAPTASERMGGEAIKVLQYVRALVAEGWQVTLVTHERAKAELEAANLGARLVFVRDDMRQILAWRSYYGAFLVDLIFFSTARRLLASIDADVVHYLCPVSPIVPRFPIAAPLTVLGPVNGNIFYPPALNAGEPRGHRVWRRLHFPVQRLMRLLSGEKQRYSIILNSGGERTLKSLVAAGASADRIVAVIDSGISSKVFAQPRVEHSGVNLRFATSGRFDPHKGFDLCIEALARTRLPITLSVFGRGSEGARLRELADRLGVTSRITFEWKDSHDELIAALRSHRGYVFPSMAEANGIVVQEAMGLGLPVVSLNWGGPEMLLKGGRGILIEPQSREQVITEIAEAMDKLAEDPALANRFGKIGRETAERRFAWPMVVKEWIAPIIAAQRESLPVGQQMKGLVA